MNYYKHIKKNKGIRYYKLDNKVWYYYSDYRQWLSCGDWHFEGKHYLRNVDIPDLSDLIEIEEKDIFMELL